MSRKDTLRALLTDRRPELPGGNLREKIDHVASADVVPGLAALVRSGAVGAMGRSLGKIAAAAEDARAMISAGDAVLRD